MDATTDPVCPSPSKKLKPDDDTTGNKLGDKALVSELDTENKLDDETLDSESDSESNGTADSESDTESKLDDSTADSDSDTKSKLDDDTAVSDSDAESSHYNDTDSDGCDGDCWGTDSDENTYKNEWCKEEFPSESDFECWCNYTRQIHLSGGFDLDEDYWGPLLSRIRRFPMDGACNKPADPVKTYKARFGELCVGALAKYNQRNQKSLEFIRVEKANRQLVRGFLYFVTFWAKDNGVERPFRAKLWEWGWKFRILSCRPKPKDRTCPTFYPLVRQS